MSTISDIKQETFTGVGVFREAFPVARYFFDVHVYEDGIAGYFVWARNHFRIPIYHNIKDALMRSSRDKKSIEEAVESDDRNFYIPFDEMQGIVTYRDHKEIQLLSSQETITFYFRPVDDYEKFVNILENKVGDKIYTRDDVEVTDSVYIS